MICKICNEVIPDHNYRISEFVDKLLSQSFEGWTEGEKNGYITACETLRHKDYSPHPVTYKNFYLSTTGIFIECNEPKWEPAYISTPTREGNTPSKYWYGTDEVGDYIIRRANHWCVYFNGSDAMCEQFKKIIKCIWHLRFPIKSMDNGSKVEDVLHNGGHLCGKIYLKSLKQRK